VASVLDGSDRRQHRLHRRLFDTIDTCEPATYIPADIRRERHRERGRDRCFRFWSRPLHAMTDAFTAAGFRISVVSEPTFAPDTPRELLPDTADRQAFPGFLFFVLHAS
jgi:hypothetical protein